MSKRRKLTDRVDSTEEVGIALTPTEAAEEEVEPAPTELPTIEKPLNDPPPMPLYEMDEAVQRPLQDMAQTIQALEKKKKEEEEEKQEISAFEQVIREKEKEIVQDSLDEGSSLRQATQEFIERMELEPRSMSNMDYPPMTEPSPDDPYRETEGERGVLGRSPFDLGRAGVIGKAGTDYLNTTVDRLTNRVFRVNERRREGAISAEATLIVDKVSRCWLNYKWSNYRLPNPEWFLYKTSIDPVDTYPHDVLWTLITQLINESELSEFPKTKDPIAHCDKRIEEARQMIRGDQQLRATLQRRERCCCWWLAMLGVVDSRPWSKNQAPAPSPG